MWARQRVHVSYPVKDPVIYSQNQNVCIESCDDVDGVRRVYIESFIEAENTLSLVVKAVERRLEGCLDEVDPEDVEEYPLLTKEKMDHRYEQYRIE